VADVTAPEHRARGMGLIGMAFGVGFVLGPLLGGLLLGLPLPGVWRLRLPFLVAAAFSTLAWVLVLCRLPESRPQENRAREAARTVSWRGIADTAALPGVGLLVSIGFLAVLAFAAFEGTFALFLWRRLHWDPQTAAFAFAGLGFVSAIVQGGLIRRLVPRFGEARLIVIGLIVAACGFAGLTQVSNIPGLIGALTLLGLGQGMLSPSISGLLSRVTPMTEQGAVFGTLTSAHTLARMISYSTANFLLGRSTAGALLGSGRCRPGCAGDRRQWFETAPRARESWCCDRRGCSKHRESRRFLTPFLLGRPAKCAKRAITTNATRTLRESDRTTPRLLSQRPMSELPAPDADVQTIEESASSASSSSLF